MANFLYTPFKEALVGGDRDWDTASVKADLVDAASYTRSAAHDFRDDVPGGARASTSAALGSKTKTGGVADAADTVFTAVPNGPACEEIVLWIDAGGADSANPLILDFDTGTGLPVTPNGGNINLNFNASGIWAV